MLFRSPPSYGTLHLKAIKILRSRAGPFGKRTASRGSGLVSRGGTWYDLLLNTGQRSPLRRGASGAVRKEVPMLIRRAEERDIPRIHELLAQVAQVHHPPIMVIKPDFSRINLWLRDISFVFLPSLRGAASGRSPVAKVKRQKRYHVAIN